MKRTIYVPTVRKIWEFERKQIASVHESRHSCTDALSLKETPPKGCLCNHLVMRSPVRSVMTHGMSPLQLF